MTDTPRTFILNNNVGEDIIHDPEHLTESCNTDQIEGRQKVDVRTAAQLIATGQARACEHCTPSEAT